MLLIGVFANRNWILGNWLKEVNQRAPRIFSVVWVPTIFAGKRWFEKYIPKFLPKRQAYFFSYLTIFEKYFNNNVSKYSNNSIVLYPHNEPELGSLVHQAQILNNAHAVYFFCSDDANALVSSGLIESKVRIALCAVDVDCVPNKYTERSKNMVVRASRYGPRKGLDILPEIVKSRPNLNFVALGRGWENFLEFSNLSNQVNFKYIELSKESRNKYFSEAKIFLSLSNLEGGPVPLIEAMSMGVYPIATKTGFAPDLINSKKSGILIQVNPEISQVLSALDDALSIEPVNTAGHLTWDRITTMMISDLYEITNQNNSI
jgi:glycosyltransferase involved in cell wall biosynthesis